MRNKRINFNWVTAPCNSDEMNAFCEILVKFCTVNYTLHVSPIQKL